MEVKVDKLASSQRWAPCTNQEMIHRMAKGNHDRFRIEPGGRCTKRQFIGLTRQVLRTEDWYSEKTISNAIIFNDSVPPDCWVKGDQSQHAAKSFFQNDLLIAKGNTNGRSPKSLTSTGSKCRETCCRTSDN